MTSEEEAALAHYLQRRMQQRSKNSYEYPPCNCKTCLRVGELSRVKSEAILKSRLFSKNLFKD
ncbi:hypothetical protein LCGC14_2273240 [marine sediment metagenome]|uniref:Uncharacterized protein n=1 Tax=marine sediment metagenome TaxID=412755 RepID=A0A0F9CWA8_9ZZZZ